ncbi:MAG: tRNA (adenosine(37)-N6)-threonylcarbamoyltransferase complex dimerization subunit type 1 TsaB [Actinobacteria bacterium]|nr:tRNA (adenosine(37)-N6)-threonylcarbamoyltransferase complex dimerization subunit type 1 TsaB [Actinomycetota bacterium]
MIILGIETSTEQVGCAIGGREGVLASVHVTGGRRHAETLTPAIDFARRQAGIELSQVSIIAVGLGPGLFTGLRVGVAAAKAIAMALRVPMVGLSSLDLLAFPVRHSPRLIVPVIDAKRGEVFTARYRHVPGGVQRMSDYDVMTPDDLASDLVAGAEECLLVGDGARRYADLFAGDDRIEVGTVGTACPSANALVELAQPRALREEFVQPAEIEPMYLRKADALINWSVRETAGTVGAGGIA